MCKRIATITEPIPVADTIIRDLISTERCGDFYRCTFGVTRKSVWDGPDECVVTARLLVPVSAYQSLMEQVIAGVAGHDYDVIPRSANVLPV